MRDAEIPQPDTHLPSAAMRIIRKALKDMGLTEFSGVDADLLRTGRGTSFERSPEIRVEKEIPWTSRAPERALAAAT
jgi:hypothetical protein